MRSFDAPGSAVSLTPALLLTVLLAGCAGAPARDDPASGLRLPREARLADVRQLTRDGQNAEAYWSFDGRWLTFQRSGESLPCDQIFRMRPDGTRLERLSDGRGRTTCAHSLPGDDRVLYSSTHASGAACPAEPDRSRGYVWPVYPQYRLYSVRSDGTDVLPAEPAAPRGYTAELTACRDGSVVFTSDRDDDLELYVAKADRFGTLTDVKRITEARGYDGGAFFSPDCRRLVWRASRPRAGTEEKEYRELLKRGLVRPSRLELWIAERDGTQARQLTALGGANFAPSFTPDGRRVVFSSNFEDPQGRTFRIYAIDADGTNLERVSDAGSFDGFPMFSPDGRRLAFSSNRNAAKPGETNVFTAEWRADPEAERAAAANRVALAADALAADAGALSDPALEGRGPGTDGGRRAEAHVERRFRELGLEPWAPLGSFRHAVPMRIGKPPVDVTPENLVGAWGEGCAKPGARPVLIGAHLDHLGRGGPESLETKAGLVHPGADDNASGVATMIEVARRLRAKPALVRGCWLFAAFAAEEAGTVGSSRLADWARAKGIRFAAMLNLDMVGRLRGNRLLTFGTESAREWDALLRDECARAGLDCRGGGDGYGPSDQMPFYRIGTPVLHFFTGPHADYHRASDTADRLNFTGMAQVAELVAAVAERAGARPPTYRRASSKPTMGPLTPAPADPHAAKPGAGIRGPSAYLGTIPDYAALVSPEGPGGGAAAGGGVPLSGARPGSPADRAGVKESDVLVSITEFTPEKAIVHALRNLQDFTQTLRRLTPGQRIVLAVRRGGKTLNLEAEVGARGEPR